MACMNERASAPADLLATIHRERLVGMHILADWWYDRMLRPRHDTGDKSIHGAIGGMLAGMVANEHHVTDTPELRQKFRDALVTACQPTTLDERGRIWWEDSVSTDYGPGHALGLAMDVCGIHSSRAPLKTGTHIYGAGLVILIGDGYGARYVPKYVAPVLDQMLQMSDEQIDALIPDEGERYRVGLTGAIYTAATGYANHAAGSDKWNAVLPRRDLEYAQLSLAKFRALAG